MDNQQNPDMNTLLLLPKLGGGHGKTKPAGPETGLAYQYAGQDEDQQTTKGEGGDLELRVGSWYGLTVGQLE